MLDQAKSSTPWELGSRSGGPFSRTCARNFPLAFLDFLFSPFFLATPSRGQQHLWAHACPLGHPGSGAEWQEKLAQRGTGEAGWRGWSPAEFSTLKVSLTCLFAQQAPIEHQWAPSRSPGPWGPSSPPLPSGSRNTGHPPSGGPSRAHPLHPLPPTSIPGLCARRPRTLPAHLPPTPGRCVQPEGRT